MKKRSGQGLGAYGRTTILPPTFSMFFSKKPQNISFKNVAKQLLTCIWLFQKVVNHFCELALFQIILKFFDLKPQQRFARILIG